VRTDLSRLLGLGLLLVGAAWFATAVPYEAPEIDPGVAATPLALVGGAALIVRSRMRRRRQ
jgi:hypothetical protein